MSDLKKLENEELEQVVGGKISAEDAYGRALQHANLPVGTKIRKKKCKLDFEDGRRVYEIEFIADGMEYEYDVDASSGKIVKFESEMWD